MYQITFVNFRTYWTKSLRCDRFAKVPKLTNGGDLAESETDPMWNLLIRRPISSSQCHAWFLNFGNLHFCIFKRRTKAVIRWYGTPSPWDEAMSRWILQKGYFYLAFGELSIYKCVVLVVVFVCLWACAFKMCNKCAISNCWVCVSTSITQQLHTTWLWIGGWILLRSESSWRFQQVAVCVDLDKLQQHRNLWKLQ